ncbi:MAG: hypothetical protein ACI9HK_002405 [Pirellulaceae bacterium]|jgi:uncharacterized protein YndB with AHSA1/START domain
MWSKSICGLAESIALGCEKPEPHVCFGEFMEITELKKVVYTWSWEPPGMDVSGSLVTVEFLDKGDSTELVLTHERLPHAQAIEGHTQGWTDCINGFVTFIEGE